MPTSEQAETALLEYKIAALEKRINDQDEHQKASDKKIDAINEERNKALKWGVTTLGTFVIVLMGVIGKYLMSRLP